MINRENKRILLPAVAADAYLHKLRNKANFHKISDMNTGLPTKYET